MILEGVYRQRRQLILEDLDKGTLQQLALVVKSGALGCLRSLSVSKTNVEDEASVMEFIGSFDEGVCAELRQLNLVFSGCGSVSYL